MVDDLLIAFDNFTPSVNVNEWRMVNKKVSSSCFLQRNTELTVNSAVKS